MTLNQRVVKRRMMAILLLLLGLSFRVVHGHGGRSCGTYDPTIEQAEQATRAMEKWRSKARSNVFTARQSELFVVDTYIHVIQEDDSTPFISNVDLNHQFDILHQRFSISTPFRFVLKEITRTKRSSWIGDTLKDTALEIEIGTALRKGGPETLNIFIQPGVCLTDRNGDVGIFGYASLPEWRGVYPVNTYSPEDLVCLCPTLLPGPYFPYDLGLTLVHEVGHWLGLLHVHQTPIEFQKNPCSELNENDRVDDTPQMAGAAFGCPINRDSCPARPGKDLVSNYMGFTDDRCMTSFTAGQVERMIAQFKEFRSKVSCSMLEATIKFELQFDSNFKETQWGVVAWGGKGINMTFRKDESYDYSNSYAVFNHCIQPGSLYEFFIEDSGGNGLEPPGFVALTLNGRKVARLTSFPEKRKAFYVVPGFPSCAGTQVYIRILFDVPPEELIWELRNAETDKVVISFNSSLFDGPSRHDFSITGSLLHVDKCLLDGTYTITFLGRDSNGLRVPVNWEVYTESSTLSAGDTLDRTSSESQSFIVRSNLSPSSIPASIPSLYPSPEPTKLSPTQSPTTIKFTLCFSGDSMVDVLGKGPVPLSRTRIGDRVLVGHKKYETIYSFGHFRPKSGGSFLEIQTNETTLKVSHHHMVYVSSSRSVPASQLRVGDYLMDANGMLTHEIKNISSATALGVYAPFTPSGRIIVDGVLSSSFIAFGASSHLEVGGIRFSYQWLAHSFELPHRMACFYFGSCPQERYTEFGISNWVAIPYSMGSWVLDQQIFIRIPILLLLLAILFLFDILERFAFSWMG